MESNNIACAIVEIGTNDQTKKCCDNLPVSENFTMSKEMDSTTTISSSDIVSSPSKQDDLLNQLINERDSARKETETSREILECVIEAVQILTSQMKKSHKDMLMNNATNRNYPSPYLVTSVSDLSIDVDGEKSNSNEVYTSRDTKEDKMTKSYEYDDLGIRPRLSSKNSVASSIATYTSEENQRFNELLDLTSESYEVNHDSEHLSRIRSGLIALSHSCSIIDENAYLLHNEASTFLIDLQDANKKLSELQMKHYKTEKVAKQLYKENKRLMAELGQSEKKKRVLIKELKSMFDEKEMRKEYEDHLLKAWNIHERILNLSKKSSIYEDSSSSSPTVANMTKKVIESDDSPQTPMCQTIGSTGITPPTSTGFSDIINEYQTKETTDGEENQPNAIASKTSWLSSLPVLQLTPSSSILDMTNNVKPTLCSNDLNLFSDKDIETTQPVMSVLDKEFNVKINLSKSNSSDVSSQTQSKSENTFKKFFFSSSKSTDASKTANVTTVIKVKLPVPQQALPTPTEEDLHDTGTNSDDNDENNDEVAASHKSPLDVEPPTAPTERASIDKLPTPKVIQRKKKQFRHYTLTK